MEINIDPTVIFKKDGNELTINIKNLRKEDLMVGRIVAPTPEMQSYVIFHISNFDLNSLPNETSINLLKGIVALSHELNTKPNWME